MKNRFVIILMLFLMITWFTPVILHDNIASGAHPYDYYNMNYISHRLNSYPGCVDVRADDDFIYATSAISSYAPFDGLLIYNATSHNIITSMNDSASRYCYLYVNGNYIFVTLAHYGILAYYWDYTDDFTFSLTLLNQTNATYWYNITGITGYGNYIFTTGEFGMIAYSFDYGNTNNFTYIDTAPSSSNWYYSIETDGTYLYTTNWSSSSGLHAYSFDGATLTLEDTQDCGDIVFDIAVDENDYIYCACRSTGVSVCSFDGSLLTLEYTRDDGIDYYYIGCNGTLVLIGGLYYYLNLYSIYDGYNMDYYKSNENAFGNSISSNGNKFYVINNYAYNSQMYIGIHIYEISPIIAPDVTTELPTGILTTNATVHGTLNDANDNYYDDYGFQWGLTTSYTEGYEIASNIIEPMNHIASADEGNTYLDICDDGNGIYYTACGNDGLRVYTYNGTGFNNVDNIDDGGIYMSVSAHNSYGESYCFVANYLHGLRVYKFNLTSGIVLLDTLDNGGEYNGVWCNISNEYPYLGKAIYILVACGSSGVRAYSFNYSNNTLVLDATRFDGTQDYLDVCSDYNGLYTACGTEGLRAYTYAGGVFTPHGSDVNGAQPYERVYPATILDCVAPFSGNYPFIFVTRGTLGIVSYRFNGITLSPTDYISSGSESFHDVWAGGKYVYTACGTEGIRSYFYDGGSFVLRATRYDGSTANYTAVYGDNLSKNIFICADNEGIKSYTNDHVGSFSYSLSGLLPSTVYHYRAFVNNSEYTGHGVDRTIYTSSLGGTYLDLNVNVYNESNGSQGIPFSIMVKNLNGSQVFSMLNQNTTCHINTSTMTGNQTILIKVWSTLYRERIRTVHIGSSLTANYTFYLPKEELPHGTDPGGGSGYTPNSSIVPFIYNIRVVETMRTEYAEFDRPIKDAWINVLRFINATGKFETMSVIVTDTNGWANLYLIPSVLYLFNITATNFDPMTSDWNPNPPTTYQQTEVKIFRMTRTGQTVTPVNLTYLMKNIAYSLEPLESRIQGAITFWYNITSTDGRLQWYRMEVFFYNTTNNTWVLINSQNETTAYGGSINYTTANITGEYKVDVYFKKIGYLEFKIYQAGSIHYTLYYLPIWIRQIPDFVWYLIIVVLMIMGMGFCFTVLQTGLLTGYLGLGIFAFGLLMKPGLIVNGFSGWIIWTITFIVYTMALFLWSRL